MLATRSTRSEQVKSVLENAKRINQEHLDAQENLENGQAASVRSIQQEEKIQEINKIIADSKRKELESVVGKTAETREKESTAFFTSLLQARCSAGRDRFYHVSLGFVLFSGGMYVAGYTRSFTATVNPLVGLDTIKRLGADYVKIFLMGFVLLVAFAVVSMVFSAGFHCL